MTLEAREISNDEGQPFRLYTFTWGNTVWRYTSSDAEVTATINAVVRTFSPIAIKDDGVRQGGSDQNDMTVTIPSNLPLADLFISTPPALPVDLEVREGHVGEAETPRICWTGFLANVKPLENDEAITLSCRTLLSSFKRVGLRLPWTRGCPHILFDTECRANPADFATAAEITALTGNTVTFDTLGGEDPEYFYGGHLEWEANGDGTIDRRGISGSSGALTLGLYGTTYRLEVGMSVVLYPGCNLTTDHCLNKFNNLPNFGGFEQMTGKNPFDGTAIV